MSFIIYNTTNFSLYRPNYSAKTYSTERSAKGALTKLIKQQEENQWFIPEHWAVTTYDHFRSIEPMVEVKSLMTGAPVQIRASDVDSCVDPSTERFWSM
jgi:hypothetical protein